MLKKNLNTTFFVSSASGKTIGAVPFSFLNKRKTLGVCVQKRFMETSVNDLRGNSFCMLEDYITNNLPVSTQLETDAEILVLYIAEALDNNIPFKQIVNNSYSSLGFSIHRDSFVSCIESFKRRIADTAFDEKIKSLDDYHIYDDQGILKKDWKWIWAFGKAADNSSNINNNVETNVVEKPVASQDKIELPIPNKEEKSSGYDVVSFCTENSTIILYTLISFTLIWTIAYIVKKYTKEEVVTTSDNETNSDPTLNSVYENLIDYSTIFITLLLLLIPSIFFTLFNFRYYYITKFKNYFLN